MNKIICVLLLLGVPSFAFGFHAPATAPHLTEMQYSQTLDHSGQVPGTFQQRFWFDDEFATGPSSPVLIRICGEDNGEYFIPDITLEHAKSLHAYVVYIEHRYYGQSMPFGDMSVDHMKYLTLENIIADIAELQKSLTDQHGLKGKWIALGGSYSGTISAIYRLLHPELVVGSLAASAPMIEKAFPESEGENDVWAYQACTTFSFWEGDPMTDVIYRPSAQSCRDIFGVTTQPNYVEYNLKYNAPFVNNGGAASNILFTSGSKDIWTQLTISAAANHNSKITTMSIPNAGHHYDLNAPSTELDTPAVLQARALFLKLAQQWLKQ